jgi:hypothetical protein
MEYGMARTTATGAAAKSARAKAVGAVKAPAKAARAKATKAPIKKPAKVAAKKIAATKTATSVAKVAKAAARAITKPAPRSRASRSAEPARPEATSQARPTLVRDSFTMPEHEYATLAAVKQACLKAGFEVKKSELLRMGVALLGQLDIAALRTVLASLPQLKTGRPPGE